MNRDWPLSFTVIGIPQPQGSTRAFMLPGMKHPVVTSDNKKNKPWRQEIAAMAKWAMDKRDVTMLDRSYAVLIDATFVFQKPKSTPQYVLHKTTKPDLDKLARSLMDALIGIAFEDDSQVIRCNVNKHFGSPARAEITIGRIGQ